MKSHRGRESDEYVGRGVGGEWGRYHEAGGEDGSIPEVPASPQQVLSP